MSAARSWMRPISFSPNKSFSLDISSTTPSVSAPSRIGAASNDRAVSALKKSGVSSELAEQTKASRVSKTRPAMLPLMSTRKSSHFSWCLEPPRRDQALSVEKRQTRESQQSSDAIRDDSREKQSWQVGS